MIVVLHIYRRTFGDLLSIFHSQVKAMLGIKREGGASMPPPPSRRKS